MQAAGPGVQDLFPDSLHLETLRDDILPFLHPVFFAIYPADEDRPRVARWQEQLCAGLSPVIVLRPIELLHVSVAVCGRAGRTRQSLRDALHEAAQHFSFRPFDLTFEATTRFGENGRAFVAIADEASQRQIDELRIALADAQRWAGLLGSRGHQAAHLTLGYGDNLPEDRRSIPPFRFHVGAVDLVESKTGQSKHVRWDRWSFR